MRCRKGGQTNAEIPAKAGAFFAGAFGAAVLPDGGGAVVGGGCAAHQRPAAPGQTSRAALLYLLGLAEIAVYFVVFTVVIRALDLPTPGRTQEPEQTEKEIDPADVRRLIEALGGPDNIRTVDNCFTRLRVTVKDTSLLDTAALLSMPHKGLVQEGQRLQLVCGLQAAQTRRLLEEQLEQCATV